MTGALACRSPRRWPSAVFALALALATVSNAQAQGGASPAGPAAATAQGTPGAVRSVTGRIVRPAREGEQGVAGVMVTLHRVGPERAGPIDSLRTSASGGYAFRYRPTGSAEALYFVSAIYDGIAYFGAPLRADAVSGDDAIITVFDTSSAPMRLRINGRHFIVSASDANERRAVTEVFELSNDSTVTHVGGRADSATFRVPLPAGVRDFQAERQGDVSPDAIQLVKGQAEIYAPIAPGMKQFAFAYTLPRDAFPLVVSTDAPAELLEVLLEDSTGTVQGAKLVRQGVVPSSGRSFVRWTAEDVPANATVTISFPRVAAPPRVPRYVVVAAGVAALLLFALRMVTSRRASATDATPVAMDPDRLAQRIAALDAAHDRRRLTARALGREPDAEEQATYEAERARLKAELTDALARRAARG